MSNPSNDIEYCEDCVAMRLNEEFTNHKSQLMHALCKASVVPQYERISRELHGEEKLCSEVRHGDTCKDFQKKPEYGAQQA